MAQALDAAWPRSLDSAEANGRVRQAQAEQRIAATWLAGSPSLEVSQREGQGSAGEGSRETDVGVALPLWRIGQRQQYVQMAEAGMSWAHAAERAARLRLAARLRDQAGKVRLAEADVHQATEQRQLLQELSADVERRVKAGDLAPVDALAAKAEMLAARTLEQEAGHVLATQRSAWSVLTGLTAAPEPEIIQTDREAAVEQHAEVQLADAAAHRLQQRAAEIQAQGTAPPELGVGVRQERPGLGQPRQNSVTLSLRVPFGSDTYNQPRFAEALAEQDLAHATQQRVRLQLAADLALARSQLRVAVDQADAERERADLLRQRAQLLRKSFQAGESSLPELLRAMSAASQAQAALTRQQAALAQAQARLQQALGQLP